MDAATLGELAPRLAGLVRRGVGLNTRAGAGRFITQAGGGQLADGARVSLPGCKPLRSQSSRS